MSSLCNHSEILTTVVSVGGALAGTILGWGLNELSRRGRLKIFPFLWKDWFEYLSGQGLMFLSTSREQAEYYLFDISLDIYNSSRDTKIMRNIEIVFSNGKHDIEKSIPKVDTARCRDISPVNIPPQTVEQLKLYGRIVKDENQSLDFIWDTKKVYLTYLNSKGKRKRILLHTESYCNRFKNQKVEEQ